MCLALNISTDRRNAVFRSTKLQMMGVLAIGALVGYLAAAMGPNWAHASPERNGARKLAAPAQRPLACSDRLNRGNMLALAGAHNRAVAAKARQKGDKPN